MHCEAKRKGIARKFFITVSRPCRKDHQPPQQDVAQHRGRPVVLPKARDHDAAEGRDADPPSSGMRSRLVRRQVDDEPHHGGWLAGLPDDADAADLDQAREWPRPPAPAVGRALLDPGAVVADEPGEQPPAPAASRSDLARERRFPAPGVAADQDARPRRSTMRGCVDGLTPPGRIHWPSCRLPGRRMTKRAPSDVGSAFLVRRTRPVLGADRAAMRLDDLARDRQAEAGILAEALLRAGRCRSARRSGRALGLDARAAILDQDLDLVLARVACGRAPARPAARRSAHCRSGC